MPFLTAPELVGALPLPGQRSLYHGVKTGVRLTDKTNLFKVLHHTIPLEVEDRIEGILRNRDSAASVGGDRVGAGANTGYRDVVRLLKVPVDVRLDITRRDGSVAVEGQSPGADQSLDGSAAGFDRGIRLAMPAERHHISAGDTTVAEGLSAADSSEPNEHERKNNE
jgi:hypothetical protein